MTTFLITAVCVVVAFLVGRWWEARSIRRELEAGPLRDREWRPQRGWLRFWME